jgi:hypothetical protein
VQQQQPATFGGAVREIAMDFDIAEALRRKGAQVGVVIAGNQHYAPAFMGHPHQPGQHCFVAGGPVGRSLEAPQIDDIADQEQLLDIDVIQEIEQALGATTAGSQMQI